jgi:hypothetical protein
MKKFYFALVSIVLLAAAGIFAFKATAQKQVEETSLVSPNIVISQFFGGGGVDTASPSSFLTAATRPSV